MGVSASGFAAVVADYRFDEPSWSGAAGEVIDASGNNYHGRSVQAAITADAVICNAGDFRTNAADHLSLDARAIDGLGDFTISLWGKTNSTSTYQTLASGANAGMANEMVMLFENSPEFLPGISIQFFNDANPIGTTAFADNNWHHFVWTRRTSNNRSCFYIDGVRQGCSVHADNEDGDPLDIDAGGFVIGQDQDAVGGGFELSQAWNGLIDELVIFDEDLNPARVRDIYDFQRAGMNWDGSVRTCQAAVPRAIYRFDESSWAGLADEVQDSSGNSYHGVALSTQPVAGKLCNAADFSASGTADYISLDEGALDGVQFFTISTWVRSNKTTNKALVSGANAGQFNELIFWLPNATTFSAYLKGGSRSMSMPNIWDGRWHHLAWTRDGTQNCIYVDGALSRCANTNTNASLSITSRGLILGQEQDSVGGSFDATQAMEGLLDELLIFDSTLPAATIASIVANNNAGLDWDGSARVCPVAAAQSLRLSHDGAGIFCAAEVIGLQARDSGGIATGYTGTVTLNTGTGQGNWRINVGAGSLVDATPDDGIAVYTFDLADQGEASFRLDYPGGAPALNIAAEDADNGLTDDDTEGLLVFAPTGFTVTANALPNPPGASVNDPLIANIAGADFDVHLAAYGTTDNDPVCGVIESYSGPKTLALWQDWVDPGTGSVRLTVASATVGVSEALATDHIINFVNGQAVLVSEYKDVGRIRLNAKEGSLRGATDAFVSRPANLRIVDIESMAAVDNPASTSMSNDPFVPAESPFVVVVDVVDADNDRTPNFGLEAANEGLVLDGFTLVAPAGGNNPPLSDAANFAATAIPGRFRNNSVAFDDIGIIEMRALIADGNYLGSGQVSGTTSGNVGRFYPDSFRLDAGAISLTCVTFTYMSAPHLQVNYQISARGSNNGVLSNYDSLRLPGLTGSVTVVAENANNGNNLGGRFVVDTASWIAGTVAIADVDASFNRAVVPDGPYTDLLVGVTVNDAVDSRPMLNPNMDASTSGNCALTSSCTAVEIGQPDIYYGRLMVLPANGPEDRALNVDLEAQYFDGVAFREFTQDSCSTYQAALAGLSNYQDNLDDGETSVVSPVLSSNLFMGHADTATPLQLSAPGINNEGRAILELQVPGWLQYDWFGTGPAWPRNDVAFGRYRGHDRIVIWQQDPAD